VPLYRVGLDGKGFAQITLRVIACIEDPPLIRQILSTSSAGKPYSSAWLAHRPIHSRPLFDHKVNGNDKLAKKKDVF
jgi:hypothetical protein